MYPNTYYPLLHRPTFERHWREGLQFRNPWYAGLTLGVFATASRWSNDERVLSDAMPKVEGRPLKEERKWHRAGWQWFWSAFCE